ncbi:MAG: hypothetical protein ABR587_17085, partial [Candidatus Binatia bacterium]
ITRFYVREVGSFLEACDTTRPIDELAEKLILTYGDKSRPLCHWSKDRLMSVEARRGWLEPDLARLA